MTAARVPIADGHPDDELHQPTTDDPAWSETCWFTFTVPERKLSGQFYPYFLANLGVAAGGAYFWDPSGDTPATCRYAKNFWHLPFPTTPLTDLTLANGLRYRGVRQQQGWGLASADPEAVGVLLGVGVFGSVATSLPSEPLHAARTGSPTPV